MATLYVNSSWSSTTVTIGGNSYTVDAVGSIAFSTISNAVEAAQDGDTINVYAKSTASIAANLKPTGTFLFSSGETITVSEGASLTVYADRLETATGAANLVTFTGAGDLTLLLRDSLKVNNQKANRLNTNLTISGGLHLTVTKDVDNTTKTWFPMTNTRKTFSVIEGSVFEVTQQFRNQESAIFNVTGSTFTAGHFSARSATANFTNAQIVLSGGYFLKDGVSGSTTYHSLYADDSAATVNILYGTKFIADTDVTNTKGISNVGTINVTQSDFSAKTLFNTGTITVTGGVASLTLTGLVSTDNGKLITVTDGGGATVSTGYVTNIDAAAGLRKINGI